jgi:hypothetical protein
MMIALYGIRLSPFQGLDYCFLKHTGCYPVLPFTPFQGKFEIAKHFVM